jgi:acetyltransferase-like isoleucine patch superfamily enzyme
MGTRKILLQLNFVLLGVLNGLLLLTPTCLLRVALLRLLFDVSWQAAVHRGLRVTSLRGELHIGPHAVVGPYCLIDNRRGVWIGGNTSLTNRVHILTLGHDLQDPARATRGAPVRIGAGCYLFTGAAVMPGVVIGDGAALGAFSVLTKNVGPHEFWAGNPAVLKGQTVPRSGERNDYRYLLGL